MSADPKGQYSPCADRIEDTPTTYACQIPSQRVLVMGQAVHRGLGGFLLKQ